MLIALLYLSLLTAAQTSTAVKTNGCNKFDSQHVCQQGQIITDAEEAKTILEGGRYTADGSGPAVYVFMSQNCPFSKAFLKDRARFDGVQFRYYPFLAKGCCKTPIFQNSIARTNNFVEKWCRDGCFELQALTGYSPRPHGLRWPMDLLAGWTHIDRSQRIVEDKRLERCGVSLIEFHASENRCGGGARRGFSTSIQPLSRAGNEQRVVQTGLLTEAEQQKQQCPADED